MSFKSNIIEYITRGIISPGSFKWYLMSGQLYEAVRKADTDNKAQFVQLVDWIYSVAPMVCYGTVAKVSEWMEGGGLEGMNGTAGVVAWKLQAGIK